MTDATDAYPTAAWQAVLYDSSKRSRHDLPCWCGNPVAGHAGWLICAEHQVQRITSAKADNEMETK